MNRIANFAKPFGIAIAFIGIAMIAVSGFYLFEYARSGADADAFNVQAAAPEDYLAFLGQGIPQPSIRDAASEPADHGRSTPDRSAASIADSDVAGHAQITVGPPASQGEGVSIASALPELSGASAIEDVDIMSISDDFVIEVEESYSEREVFSLSIANLDQHSEASVLGAGSTISAIPSSSLMMETFASIYPGGNMNPRYWSDPHWAGNMPFGGPTIPAGFVPVDAADLGNSPLSGARGLRMRIPAINLDATVSELELRDLGDYRQWSTPDRVVGHIPTTANPGEPAHGWYFGHLSNFLSNEGDIFRRLPEVAAMIKNDPVDIFLITSDAEYMYRVTASKLLHRDDLNLTETSDSQITLVTCWPHRVYDHRVLVSAVLIAVKELPEA